MLGVDFGTTSCRSILVNENGRVIGSISQPYSTYTSNPNWAEQNPEDWYSAFKKVFTQLIISTRVSHKNIISICVDGMLSSPVYLDAEGRILRSTIIWMDQRILPQVQLIKELIDEGKVFNKTYNPITATFALNSLGFEL